MPEEYYGAVARATGLPEPIRADILTMVESVAQGKECQEVTRGEQRDRTKD